jgi:hypothetical protein
MTSAEYPERRDKRMQRPTQYLTSAGREKSSRFSFVAQQKFLKIEFLELP